MVLVVSCTDQKYNASTKASNISECDVIQSVEMITVTSKYTNENRFKVTTKKYNFHTDKLFQVGDTLLIKVYRKNDN